MKVQQGCVEDPRKVMVHIKMMLALWLGCCVVHSSPSLFSYQTFSHLVLPKYEVLVKLPKMITLKDKELTVSVCGL